LQYLGEIQMDQASPPDPVALAKLCQYADAHPSEGNMQLYCGALLFRRDYASGEKTGAEEILRRLQAAGRLKAANAAPQDRKSTRLNSSHVAISYAVFCLKKKKTKITP